MTPAARLLRPAVGADEREDVMAMSAVPVWPKNTAHPRVLLECEDDSIQDGVARALRESGYAVAACSGPASRGSGRCPLVAEGRCGLVEDADVVVHILDPGREQNCEVLVAIRQSRPHTPVVVETVDGGDGRDPALLATTHRVRYPMSRDRLVAAVHEAVEQAVQAVPGKPRTDPTP